MSSDNEEGKVKGRSTGNAGGSVMQPAGVVGQVPAASQRQARRRGFLAGAGAAGAGVAAVALAARPSPPAVPGEAAPARKEAAPAAGRGYHETAHIRKYYDTTKV